MRVSRFLRYIIEKYRRGEGRIRRPRRTGFRNARANTSERSRVDFAIISRRLFSQRSASNRHLFYTLKCI